MMTRTVFSIQRRDQNRNADKHNAENCGNGIVDQHRDLEIERFFSVGVDFRRVATFHQPDDERPEDVPQEMKKIIRAMRWRGTARTRFGYQKRCSEPVAEAVLAVGP